MPTETECWIWEGPVNAKGYGRMGQKYAHRMIYEAAHGPIPEGYVVHHLCETPPCVNPEHLEAMSRREHSTQEGHSGHYNSSKTSCPAGHLYDEANTIIESRSDGGEARRCRTCREAQRQTERKTTGPTNAELAELNICRRGHSMENAVIRKDGTRMCRECANWRGREYRRKRREENPLPPREPSPTCKNGHTYDLVGVYEYRGKRYCMECRREADRRRHAAKRST